MASVKDTRPIKARTKSKARNSILKIWNNTVYRWPLWKVAVSRLPEPKIVDYPYWCACDKPDTIDSICSDLEEAGISLEDYNINLDKYRSYLASADYESFPSYCGGGKTLGMGFEEKALEHFVSFDLLDIFSDDVYVDVASCSSPAPDIVRNLYGAKVYRQDLSFREGIHGMNIGGDAGAMQVPDGFASKMSLHCSFEHFEGDADIRLIRDLERVLSPGGRACILPLYLDDWYRTVIDPIMVFWTQPEFDDGATIVMGKIHNRFGRIYDVPHFIERVAKNIGKLSMTVYRVVNAKEIHPSCYLTFAALITKDH